jgi:hypothetical protein
MRRLFLLSTCAVPLCSQAQCLCSCCSTAPADSPPLDSQVPAPDLNAALRMLPTAPANWQDDTPSDGAPAMLRKTGMHSRGYLAKCARTFSHATCVIIAKGLLQELGRPACPCAEQALHARHADAS